MTPDKKREMADVYREAGYDLNVLKKPGEVEPDELTEGSLVVVYTNWADTTAEHGNSTWRVDEVVVGDGAELTTTEELAEETEVSIPADEITHCVIWGYKNGWDELPEVVGIDHSFDEERFDWDRLQNNVLGRSDEFVRVVPADDVEEAKVAEA